jgi:hypothetical protein
MRLYLIFLAMSLTACNSANPVYIEREVPRHLVTPCAAPVKGARSEGGFAELALGWKATATCNADKLRSVGRLVGPQ